MIALDLIFVRDTSWARAFAWADDARRAARAAIASGRERRAVGPAAESDA
jgi:hypothetical protein